MSVSTPPRKRLVMARATGMVGQYALRYALEISAVKSVTSIGRKKLGLSHPKLNEVLQQDFGDCSALADTLADQDAAVFCLGPYTGAVAGAEFCTITVNYPVEFARVLRFSSPGAAFSFLSGNGADRREEVGCLSQRSLRRDFLTFISSGQRTSTPWNHGRNRTQLQPAARDLPCVSDTLPLPSDSGRRLGACHGERRRPSNSDTRKPGFREP
jgi:hypothetical protein